MMRRGRLACAAMVIAGVCGAGVVSVGGQAPSASRPDAAPPRDIRIQALVADAMAIPSEFASDALLRVAGSGLVTDAQWRREILETAYMRAYDAQESYRRTSVGIPPDTRQGAMTLASESTLNRVSLQVRSTQLLAPDFPARARELFEWIDPNTEAATCGNPLVPAVDEYYLALSALARTTFDREHRDEAVRFLELFLWRARLPTDMPSVARAILRFGPDEREAAYLESAFRWILDLGETDARGFSTATLNIVLRSGDLQQAHHELGVPGWYVMEGLRDYLLAQLAGPRCSDSVTEALTPSAFNDTMRSLRGGGPGVNEDAFADVKPIDPKEIRPGRMLAAARIDPYWLTPDARRLHDDLLRLRGPDRPPITLAMRQSADWQHRAERYLVDVDRWNGRGEASERDYFYQKAVLFTGILDLMPAAGTRTTGLRLFVDFLRHADIDRSGRNLWFVFVTRLASTRGEMRKEALAALERSGHPILSLYARLEAIAPSGGRQRESGDVVMW
jgi:hypothetical protein